MTRYFVYVVRCSDGSLYTGWTTDVAARVAQHNVKKGAKYTRSRLPVALVYREQLPSRQAALLREREIKKLSRQEKNSLLYVQPVKGV